MQFLLNGNQSQKVIRWNIKQEILFDRVDIY